MAESFTLDSTDVEFLSLQICNVCGRRLFPGDQRYKVGGVVLCYHCNCGSDFVPWK